MSSFKRSPSLSLSLILEKARFVSKRWNKKRRCFQGAFHRGADAAAPKALDENDTLPSNSLTAAATAARSAGERVERRSRELERDAVWHRQLSPEVQRPCDGRGKVHQQN